ncbi:probable G-protein coupled receptor 158 [Lampris incognitus]|uniref:probable G-protein coupled receptor 158 n=1 Tax=Lampris incognitus TaxID=2546036 RepID=UPI0024B63374|nr:probable G-protein coupled receptor 158 [Lampris incognitus]
MAPVLLLLLLLPRLARAQPPTLDLSKNRTDSAANVTSPPEVQVAEVEEVDEVEEEEEEEEDWSPVETFLYSGDPSVLEAAGCPRPYSVPGQSGPPPASFQGPLLPAVDALANTANFFNMAFQASDLRESSVYEDMEWYHAAVRALLQADTRVEHALLTFDADPAAAAPQLVLGASRDAAPKVQTILLQDLSKAWESLHPPAPAPDDSWFTAFKFQRPGEPSATLSKRILVNDLSTLDTPKWGRGDSYVTNRSGVRWASAPFLDCKDGRFLPSWRLTLSASFYGLKPDLTPEFRGVIRVDVNIQNLDIDQCAMGDAWFANTHQCNRTTMECEPIPGQGFRLGQYCCRCKEGYYSPPMASEDTDGGFENGNDTEFGEERGDGMCYPAMPICLPCWPGCKSCQDGAPCWVQEDWFLRSAVLAVQGFFMLLVFVSMLAAYQHRRSRRIRASGLLLLETILFGSLLLYFPVFILYFKPSTFRCILLRWVRMLGFSIVYGTVTLKLYRVLKVFLSRTAQRMPYMSSLHLLRILAVMLVTVGWFLCAWTVGILQNRDRNIPVLITSTTSDGQGFSLCYLDRWDYMMAVAELLFLCWGISLCSAVKPVPSAFHEPRYMGIAIHNELLLSSMFHLLRFVIPSLHPDWMLLLFFTHTHVTITVTLALLFVPKFLHISKPGKEEIAAEVYEDEVDLRRSGSYLNSSFHSTWSDHTLEPDDIRDELKKLYAQLEVHKTKKLTSNNPHLSKKRSSRRALGRSIIRRIAEIPESMSRQCSREEKEIYIQSKGVNQSESLKRAPDPISVSYKESVKSISPVMRKSQSEHDYVRERDFSLHDTMLRANIMKRASQRSETDSLDIPPEVCKSASAQNLTINNNLLHPDHTRLHKSRSLSSTNTHIMEDKLKVSRASSMLTTSTQSISIKDQTTSALKSQSFDKAEICPWEVEEEKPTDKNQKHVTYAPAQDEECKSPNSLHSPLVHVCPWDHLPPPEKKNSVEKGFEGECESPKPQAPVSASAPGSPRPKVEKDQRVFSFRTSTQKWLSVKALMGSLDAGVKDKPNKEAAAKREDSLSQKSHDSWGTASTSSKSATASRNPSFEKRTLQKRSLTTTEGKPCLVKQNAIRLSSGDSSDRSPRRLVIMKSAVYPWDAEDMQKDTMFENLIVSRQNSTRSNASSWETGGTHSRTPSTHTRVSSRITPTHNVSHADVYPWDGPTSSRQGQGPQREQSIKANICPWEVQETQSFELSSVCPWETQGQEAVRRQDSSHAELCPWESQVIPTTSNILVSKQFLQRQKISNLTTEICPWESVEAPHPSMKQGDVNAEVCPWDAQEKADIIYENAKPLETKGSLKVVARQETIRPSVCSGSLDDTSIDGNKQEHRGSIKVAAISAAVHLAKNLTKTVETCPWEFPDTPNVKADVCPWEVENMVQLVTKNTTESSSHGAMWESQHQNKSKDSGKDACTWENTSAKREGQDNNICPWETAQPENTATTEIHGSMRMEKTEEQTSVQIDICPWETDYLDIVKKQESTKADVCPWETEEPETSKMQVSKNSGTLIRQDTAKAEVCPWETEEPGTVKAEIAKTPEKLQRQESLEVVCPWETTEPATIKKQDSYRADACPWETEDPQISTQSKVENNSADTVSEMQGRVYTEVISGDSSTQETEELKPNLALGRRDALCPWEMERLRSGSFSDLDNASDVFTWEPENIPEEDEEEADAECAAEAFVFPPDL